jgi:mitogen-activated protein kinase kinase kinase
MEYLPLGSIKSIIKESSPLKERAARNYIRQAVRGLEYLHNMYVTHCDIKCDNLLVSANGIIKVADFGCSFRFESESFQFNENSVSEDRAIRGSVPWLAPEVIHGARHRPTSDIWAIGIVLIEMLTGTHPWRNQKNVLSLAWHIADLVRKPLLVPKLPLASSDEAKSFLGSCLALEPTERSSATHLTNHPFLRFNNGRPLNDGQ